MYHLTLHPIILGKELPILLIVTASSIFIYFKILLLFYILDCNFFEGECVLLLYTFSRSCYYYFYYLKKKKKELWEKASTCHENLYLTLHALRLVLWNWTDFFFLQPWSIFCDYCRSLLNVWIVVITWCCRSLGAYMKFRDCKVKCIVFYVLQYWLVQSNQFIYGFQNIYWCPEFFLWNRCLQTPTIGVGC